MADGQALVVAPEARALGVRPGMRTGGIMALAPQALLLERNEQREQATLHAVTLALFRFTPEIMHEPDFGLLLDIGASLTLFGGPARLARTAHACLRTMGVTARLGAAPPAARAWLLARRQRQQHVPQLRRRLRLCSLGRAPAWCGAPARNWPTRWTKPTASVPSCSDGSASQPFLPRTSKRTNASSTPMRC